ncbi:gamma-glutamylcyclotransferase family protein [Rubrivivax rivuli]|nr:gamma-glutamylcyclotransferase family protein [Rubrivivax rivuli]
MDEAVTFLSFAYGSNMLTARLRERVSSARPVGTACLPGFSLHWHKVSVDGSGKCDVVEDATSGACVWGVVFAIESAQKDSLDKSEGLGNGYGDRKISVMLGGATLTAQAYVATRTDVAYLPYDWYKALVVAGAHEHALPPHYVAALEAQPFTVDANEERRRKNLLLINAR